MRPALVLLLAACGASARAVPLRVPLIPHAPTGFPSPGALYTILNDPIADVRACLALSPGTTGEHPDRMTFAIQPDGSVSDIETEHVRSPAAAACYTQLLASKHYPLPDAKTPVLVVVDFNAELGVAWMRMYSLCE